MKKSSSDNNRVLKNSNSSHDVKPFLLRSIGISGENPYDSSKEEKESLKVKIETEAYEKGFAEGLDTGRLQMLDELGKELTLVRTLIDGIQKLSTGIYGMIETDIVELSLAIARKVVYEAAEKEREVVVNTVREAIRKTSDRETLKVRISPIDYDILSKNKSELLQVVDGIKSIYFDVDETIHPGGCLVETNHGDIDARIDSQFSVIEDEIRRAVNKNQTSEELC
ncbi:MAG: FliH/SctL family protein [Nitrospira sp.]|nr:FliH/SctL family protein [Nitrospira sp.]